MILELCKGVHCVDLGENFQTHVYLQMLASIQPGTSPLKFARSSGAPVVSDAACYLRESNLPQNLLSLRRVGLLEQPGLMKKGHRHALVNLLRVFQPIHHLIRGRNGEYYS